MLPAGASAAPFGEVAFRPAGGTATCLRAIGLPGEVVRSTSTGAQFLMAGPGGPAPVADVERGTVVSNCPQAAARPNGAGIVAFADNANGGGTTVQADLREPGGPRGPVTDVATSPQLASGHPLAADVSDRGDALVAFATGGNGNDVSFHAVRRAPGGSFGSDETVFAAPERAA